MVDSDDKLCDNVSMDWRTLLFTVTKIDAREVYGEDELPLEFVIPSTNKQDTFY